MRRPKAEDFKKTGNPLHLDVGSEMFWRKRMPLKSLLLGSIPTARHTSMQLHELSVAVLGEERTAWGVTEMPLAAGETAHFPTQSVTALGLGAHFPSV